MSSFSVERCRQLLREGGVAERELSDEAVRNVRDSLAALADILIDTLGTHHQ